METEIPGFFRYEIVVSDRKTVRCHLFTPSMVISPRSNPMTRSNASAAGFTLVEVLIAMAITALISVVAYTGLSSALSGAESSA
ncbi:MAG: hypothetical protein CM15mP89_1740 [Gammaproteobacteria bacterium]|nr:MAG: hypothetical protein CM15mP89_1740 [Gammaproteobacteria bacterium]